MFTSTQDKEAKFIACLLANGPPPNKSRRGNVDYDFSETPDYRTQIMEWWRDSHKSKPDITDKALHRFYNRYVRWLANERYRQRRANKYIEGQPW